MTEIWVIIDTESNQPIITASSQENANNQLFDYMGYDPLIENKEIVYLGFNKYIYSEFEDDYIGVYTFESIWNKKTETDKFKLYCKILDAPQK
jgi:hypothetical protein